MKFKRITLHFNANKRNSVALARRVRAFLESKNVTVDFCNECEDLIFPPKTDLLICVGGDGTVLHSARRAALFKVPVLGLNSGTLGFLTSVEGEHFKEHLEKILSGHYTKAERTLLNVNIYRQNKLAAKNLTAVNECVLKASGIRAFTTEITYEKYQLNEYFGDGIIVATPTGSTAYSLAAGGPIVAPGVNTFLLTPVCPHTISQRPMVLPEGKIILTPRFKRPKDTAVVSLDGQGSFIIESGDRVEITRSKHKAVFIYDKEYDYFKNLYNKFKWGRY